MGDTLAEVIDAAKAVEAFEPFLEAFVPASTPFVPLFNAAIAGADAASKSTSAGKPLTGIVDDVILALENGLGLAPGTLANAPSPTATLNTTVGAG